MLWPMALTLFRLAIVPVIALTYTMAGHHLHAVSGGLFVAAALSDGLDGYLARRLGQETPFGAFIDPVADKLLVATVLVLMVHKYASLWVTLAAWIIVGREITVSALREWMAEMGQHMRVSVLKVAKIKTAIQLVALTVLLVIPGPEWLQSYRLALTLLMLAVVLTLVSMLAYLKRALPVMRQGMSVRCVSGLDS